ncbi:MAG: mycothiol synthase [Ilumatobacteraceae bacterium]
MPHTETWMDGDRLDRPALDRLMAAATAVDGHHPLSDHLRMDLARGAGSGFAAVTARTSDQLVGYAQLSEVNGLHTVEVVVEPTARADLSIAGDLLHAAIDVVATRGGGAVQWWSFDADRRPQGGADDAGLAAKAGLALTRSLYQMRCELPTGLTVDVPTRSFEPGADEAAWLRVNNRAFATHPEQGGWTMETLALREAEPWFDADGFRLHERDGRLAAFCWTKLHTDTSPVLGEIYVIAVDPDFQGLGLGRQLTLAGLASIADRGVAVGMLYVDADNTAAVTMYEHIGFTIHRTDRAYTADIEAAPA